MGRDLKAGRLKEQKLSDSCGRPLEGPFSEPSKVHMRSVLISPFSDSYCRITLERPSQNIFATGHGMVTPTRCSTS